MKDTYGDTRMPSAIEMSTIDGEKERYKDQYCLFRK